MSVIRSKPKYLVVDRELKVFKKVILTESYTAGASVNNITRLPFPPVGGGAVSESESQAKNPIIPIRMSDITRIFLCIIRLHYYYDF